MQQTEGQRWAATVVFAVLCAVFLFITSGGYEQWKEENSGIPDALSSISDGTTCRLIVVANRSGIRDAEEFAEEVIKMCRGKFIPLSASVNRYRGMAGEAGYSGLSQKAGCRREGPADADPL